MQQAVFRPSQPPRKPSAQLPSRLPNLVQRARRNQIMHGLSLRQIEAAGSERPLSKLARLRQPNLQPQSPPSFQRSADYRLQHHRRPMRRNLHDILAGIRTRSPKRRHHRLIDDPLLRSLDNPPQPGPPMVQFGLQRDDFGRHGQRRRPRKPHYPNPATSRRGRNRHNCLARAHLYIDTPKVRECGHHKHLHPAKWFLPYGQPLRTYI